MKNADNESVDINMAMEYLNEDILTIKTQIANAINSYKNGNHIGQLKHIVGVYPHDEYAEEIVRVFLIDIGFLN